MSLEEEGSSTARIKLHSGRWFHPLDPRPEDVDIEDIAHALAHKCRFTGHTSPFYSVAQHCCHVASMVPLPMRLRALVHDGSEFVLPDVSRPIKAFIPGFYEMEDRVTKAILKGLRITEDGEWHATIKEADNRMVCTEGRDIMTGGIEEWDWSVEPYNFHIEPWSMARSKDVFLTAYRTYRRIPGATY